MAAIGIRRNVWRTADGAVEGVFEGSRGRLSMNDPPTALVGFGKELGGPFYTILNKTRMTRITKWERTHQVRSPSSSWQI